MRRSVTRGSGVLLILAALLLFCLPAHAQTSSTPYSGFTQGVACTPDGKLAYNGNSFVACTSGAWAVQPVTIGTASSAPYTCSSTYKGMVYFDTAGSGLSVCTGSSWSSLVGGGGGSATIYLGTSASVTNPARSAGELTTGLFSPNSGEVGISSLGTEQMRVTATGLGVGSAAPTANVDVDGSVIIGNGFTLL
jgi:hypothetical protein